MSSHDELGSWLTAAYAGHGLSGGAGTPAEKGGVNAGKKAGGKASGGKEKKVAKEKKVWGKPGSGKDKKTKPKKDDAAGVSDAELSARQLVAPTASRVPMGAPFYITTAIFYTNGNAHIGHAYEAVTTDIIARYHRVAGRDTFFLTGSDEHGQKIQQTADDKGVQPIEICDKYAGSFQEFNGKLGITNDHYVRTTHPEHAEFARGLWKVVDGQGDIYLDRYSGWYNVREETYVTETDAAAAEYKDAYGTPLQKQEEESYFFRMSKYRQRLLDHIHANPDFVRPARRREEILSFLKEPLRDLCVSRTKCQWGIPVPDAPGHVMYVWFDALSNYLSGIGYDLATKTCKRSGGNHWPCSVHIIGKDITRFHCVYWPCMLMSAGIALPQTVYGHGFVNAADGRKMSKSLNNSVDPNDLLAKYPLDAIRFFLARGCPYGQDLSCDVGTLVALCNSELNDALGNLVNRCTNLAGKYGNGKVADVSATAVFDLAALRTRAAALMKEFKLYEYIIELMEVVKSTNKYLQDAAPWAIKDDSAPDAAQQREAIVRSACEAVYILAHFLEPVIPVAAAKIFSQLGVEATTLPSLSPKFDNLPVGTSVWVTSVLFPRLEAPEAPAVAESKSSGPASTQAEVDAQAAVVRELKTKGAKKGDPALAAALEKLIDLKGRLPGGGDKKKKGAKPAKPAKASKAKAAPAAAAAAAGDQPAITKLDLRVGTIVKCWKHPDSEKLWCEEIDVGEDQPRQIASGLQQYYSQPEMEGHRVIVVCNLKKSKLGGFDSYGMVLCAKSDTAVEFVTPPAGVPCGERVQFAGMEGEPVGPAQVKKKKVIEAVSPDFKTNDACVATFQGVEMMTSGGPCTVKTVKGGFIN